MISVAAELAGMHPQTLRIYEARGLVKPSRSPKQTRLYSQRDVERLRRISRLTTQAGMNLAGVERVLALEEMMESMQAQLERLERHAEQIQQEMAAQIERVHRSYRRELVPWKPPGEMQRLADAKAGVFKIPISKDRKRGDRYRAGVEREDHLRRLTRGLLVAARRDRYRSQSSACRPGPRSRYEPFPCGGARRSRRKRFPTARAPLATSAAGSRAVAGPARASGRRRTS